MARHSSVVVNHQVTLPGTKGHAAIGNHRLDYIRTRLGSVQEPTEDDVVRQAVRGREDALGYIAHRRGAIFGDGKNHALFDADGVADYAKAKQELVETKSAILTSVVSVRREDAEELGLQTKQDFQRFLRANWAQHLEQMGIAEPQDIRYVAAFHVNSEKNFHVHVISWDASGRFGSLIPKKKLELARRNLVDKALRPARQKISTDRTQVRDELVARIRDAELGEREQRAMAKIAKSLPATGSLKYGHLASKHPDLKSSVDGLVRFRLESDPTLSEKLDAYKKAVVDHADLKGLSGRERELYKLLAMDDLRTRLGNAQLSQIKAFAGISEPSTIRRRSSESLDIKGVSLLPTGRRHAAVVEQELRSCLTRTQREDLANVVEKGQSPAGPTSQAVASLPSLRHANDAGRLPVGSDEVKSKLAEVASDRQERALIAESSLDAIRVASRALVPLVVSSRSGEVEQTVQRQSRQHKHSKSQKRRRIQNCHA